MNYHIINQNAVVLNFDGKVVNVTRSTFPRFGELMAHLKNKDVEAVKLMFDEKVNLPPEEFIKGSGLRLVSSLLIDADSETLPANLSNKIIELHNDGFDVSNLINFWNNIKENPSRNSREQLYRFLCDNEHPITDDGHFIAYRSVTKNFKDHRTGKFDNSVGNVLEMPRRDVDDNPNSHCSHGFHVAKFGYASTFGSNRVLVAVKVNPRDVVAVPADANGQKMRVCRFEVMEVIEQKFDGIDFTNSMISYCNEEKFDDWGDSLEDDDDDEALEYKIFVNEVIDNARFFKDKYQDIAYLAVRISEDMEDNHAWDYDHDQSPAGVLKVLTQNKDQW